MILKNRFFGKIDTIICLLLDHITLSIKTFFFLNFLISRYLIVKDKM